MLVRNPRDASHGVTDGETVKGSCIHSAQVSFLCALNTAACLRTGCGGSNSCLRLTARFNRICCPTRLLLPACSLEVCMARPRLFLSCCVINRQGQVRMFIWGVALSPGSLMVSEDLLRCRVQTHRLRARMPVRPSRPVSDWRGLPRPIFEAVVCERTVKHRRSLLACSGDVLSDERHSRLSAVPQRTPWLGCFRGPLLRCFSLWFAPRLLRGCGGRPAGSSRGLETRTKLPPPRASGALGWRPCL